MTSLAGRKQSKEHIRRRIEARLRNNPNYISKNHKVWNKGKTKETDERIKEYAERMVIGKKLHTAGYVEIYIPYHPKAVRGYVMEHRLIVEMKIGRFLFDNERVHHINGIKNDNRIENLQVMTNAEHSSHHSKGRKMPEGSGFKAWKTRYERYGSSGGNFSELAYKAWETRRSKV